MRKLLRKTRAISPIFAVLILIAIAVMGGVVVYLFTSGYLGGMTGGGGVGQEKVGIQAIIVSDTTPGLVTLSCKNIAGNDVVITDAILKTSGGETVEVVDITDVLLPADGTMTDVPCQFTVANLVAGHAYTVTLVSQQGNQFVSSAFTA